MTAEHVNTGTVAELIVNVDTLQDKLFLFQFTPAVETTLRYTNGDGVQKEVTSMADGRAAIYEESGIQGDVYLESQQGDTEYFGTLYNENLVSTEKDSTQLELYPVNYMTLRKAALRRKSTTITTPAPGRWWWLPASSMWAAVSA